MCVLHHRTLILCGLVIGLLIAHPVTAASLVWVAGIGSIDTNYAERLEGELARRDFRVIQDSQRTQHADRSSVLRRAAELGAFFGQHQVLILQPSVHLASPTLMQVQLTATVHLSHDGELKTAWTSPKQDIGLDPNCRASCRDQEVQKALISLTTGLGSTLATLLSHDRAGVPAPAGERRYSVLVLDLDPVAERQLIDIMINEFPMFRDVGNTRKQGSLTSFQYWTGAREDQLIEWLSIALASLDLEINTDVALTVTDDTIELKNLFLVEPKPVQTHPLFR